VLSASYAITASYAPSASLAITASYVPSASLAITASYALSASYAITASYAPSASLAITSSYVSSSTYATSASYANTASFFISSSYSLTASYALNGGGGNAGLVTGSTYPITSSWAIYAETASVASGSFIVNGNTFLSGTLTIINLATNPNLTGGTVGIFDPILASNGNIGIGVGKTQTIGNSGFFLWNGGYDGTFGSNGTTTGFVSIESYNQANPIRLWANQVWVSGKMSIGNSSPTNSLDVSGNISCSVITASLFFGTASYAITASYALNGGEVTLTTGSTYPITASWATSSISASYALSSSHALSSSYALSASYVSASNIDGVIFSSSYAFTSSYALNAGSAGTTITTGSTYPITASWATSSISASYSLTASYALNAGSSGTTLTTGSTYQITASWASSSISSSYSLTASYFSGSITSASYALSASYFSGSITSASYALTASYALNGEAGATLITGANYFITASTSIFASTAVSSDFALDSQYCVTASYTIMAGTSSYLLNYVPTISASWASASISSSYAVKTPIQLPDITDDTINHFVGINQPSPKYILDVNGTIGNSINYGYLITSDGNDSYLNANGGNVGIGTNQPQEALDVNGRIVNTTNGDYLLNIQGDNSYINANGGNVGIGTNDPSYNLDVHGTIGNTDGYEFLINNNGQSSYFNANGGNVGIGRNNPAHALDVRGSINFSTGSLLKNGLPFTASMANSASFALTASYINTASYANSSSVANSASYANTASYVNTASYAKNAVSASYANSASYSPIQIPEISSSLTGHIGINTAPAGAQTLIIRASVGAPTVQHIHEHNANISDGGLAGGSPCLLTLQTIDDSLYYNLGYKSDAYGSIANYISNGTSKNSLVFDFYTPTNDNLGTNELIGYGGYAMDANGSKAGMWTHVNNTTWCLGLIGGDTPSANTPLISWNSGSKVGINTTLPFYTLDVNGDINFTTKLLQNGLPFTASTANTASYVNNAVSAQSASYVTASNVIGTVASAATSSFSNLFRITTPASLSSSALIISQSLPLSQSFPVLDMLSTWSGSSTNVFTGIRSNIIDSGSSPTSKYIDLQRNGSSMFSLSRTTDGTGWLQFRIGENNNGGCVFSNYNADSFVIRPQNNIFGLVNQNICWGTSATNLENITVTTVLLNDTPSSLAISTTYNGKGSTPAAPANTGLKLYNYYSSSVALDYERANNFWSGSNYYIATEQTGSGKPRNINFLTSGSNRLFISGSGQIGLGTTTPVNTLDVVGNISCSYITASLLGTVISPVNIQTNNYAIQLTDSIIIMNGSTALSASLPSASINTGAIYKIKNVSPYSLTITGSQNIDAVSNGFIVNQWSTIELVSSGNQYYII
jgi:hypothetical protein